MSFDPDELFNMTERLRAAFNRAAEADSGSAQRLFQKLADKVDRLYNQAMDPANQGTDPQKMLFKMMPSIMDLQFTMKQIKAEAERNPQAARVLEQLSAEMQQELKSLLPMLGNIPGIPGLPKLPGMDFGQPKEPPKNPPAPPAPPKKPGGGKFKF